MTNYLVTFEMHEEWADATIQLSMKDMPDGAHATVQATHYLHSIVMVPTLWYFKEIKLLQ